MLYKYSLLFVTVLDDKRLYSARRGEGRLTGKTRGELGLDRSDFK